MNLIKAVTTRIEEILNEKHLTWSKLEKDSGISKGTMNSIQYRRYKSINLETLVIIIRTLGLSIDEFFKSEIFNYENIDV